MKRLIMLSLLACCLAGSAWADDAQEPKGSETSQVAGEERVQEASQGQSAATVVEEVQAGRGTLRQYFSAPVELDARARAQLVAEVSGTLKSVNVKAGDGVTKNQLLVTLDDGSARAGLASAAASVASAKESLASAEAALSRQKRLIEQGYMAPASLESAQSAVTGAKSALAAAQSGAASAKAAANLYALRSPIDGIVLRAVTSPLGSQVAPGTLLVDLADTSGFEAQMAVPYARRSQFAVGAHARVLLADGTALRGKVSQLGTYVDPSSRTFTLTMSFEPAEGALVGAYGTGEVVFAQQEGVIVPTASLLSDGKGDYLWLDVDGKAACRGVKVLMRKEDYSVVEGVKEGEWVISRGNVGLTEGEALDPFKVAVDTQDWDK